MRTEKRRNVEKGCAFLLACLAMVAAFAGGWPLLIAGFGQQREADNLYTVDFRHDHDDCGASKLTIDLDTGRALQCVPLGVRPYDGGSDLPGFTDAQNEQVIALSEKLSRDGLLPPERKQIQALVDKFAATVPAAERGDRHSGLLWGARMAWTGVALELIALLLYLFVVRTPRPAKPARPPRGKHE